MRLTNVREEAWMGGAAVGEVVAGFVQAEGAVDREADFASVGIFLAVIFPPANRA
jgi:hypothetical protein